MQVPQYQVMLLNKQHGRLAFECGNEALDRYLKQQATQDIRNQVAATYVLTPFNTHNIIGYYTLSSFSIVIDGLAELLVKKPPRYPVLPATLLGRLAVDKNFQGKKLGGVLLINALKRCLALSEQVASMAVVVEAKHKEAEAFYSHYGFTSFLDEPSKLYLPMGTIKQLKSS